MWPRSGPRRLDTTNLLGDVRRELYFLIREHGFSIEEPKVDLVRCTNGRALIRVEVSDYGFFLGLSIMRPEDEGDRARHCDIGSIVRCFSEDPQTKKGDWWRHGGGLSLRQSLRAFAWYLERYGEPLLRGDSAAFEELYAFRKHEIELYNQMGPTAWSKQLPRQTISWRRRLLLMVGRA